MSTVSNSDEFMFYRSLARTSPELGQEQEAALARRLKAHGDRRAADALARCCQRHVLSLAMKYRRYGVPVNELVAEGNFGVVQALAKFQPERGVRFVTYASYWIRAQMLGYVVRSRSAVGGSDGPMRSQLFFKLRRERARVFGLLGESEAAFTELARRLGVSVERLNQLLQRLEARDVSLEADAGKDGRGPLERLAAADDQERELFAQRSAARLARLMATALERLDPRERCIVERHLMAERGEELSLSELARSLGISRERARQLQARALGKLRGFIVEQDQSFVVDFLERAPRAA